MVYTKEAEKHSKIGYDAFDAPYIGLEGLRGCCCLQHAHDPIVTWTVYPRSHQYRSLLYRTRC